VNLVLDRQLAWFFGGVLAFLAVATVVGRLLAGRRGDEAWHATVANLNARIKAWWVIVAVFAVAIGGGRTAALVLFAIVSFLALREFITLTPTRRGDHRTLFYTFFAAIPLQYYLIAIDWYGLFSILIPVYGFLFVPTRSVLSGETGHFLERISTIQWGLMVCVYCVSHAPALLLLDIPGYEGQNAKLLLYLLLVAQMSDVLQYVWGKLLGRHAVAPTVSPSKTVEGLVGGVASATLLGTLLWPMTPFSPWQAAGMSLVITLMGFAGGLTMSAIKRDRGVKDFGALIAGHGGMLDRLDSICFASPIFFHLTRYFFAR
jgi:phosphatidate cytidylyltransferase